VNFEEYKKAFYADPEPEQRYSFAESIEATLFFEDFDIAVAFYEKVLGPPAYVEGTGTKSWRIGGSWLTFLRGKSGNPKNVEVTFPVDTPEEAERLQQAFIDAGGTGPAPTDELMYEPVRFCSVKDPLGTDLLIISPLRDDGGDVKPGEKDH
jgi:hypothetical protein